jgi:hypothetical protein
MTAIRPDLLDNPIRSENGHRYGCAGNQPTGQCACDKPYRFRRRLIVSGVVVAIIAALVLAVAALVIYAPDLGIRISEWFLIIVMVGTFMLVIGMVVWGIATAIQKALWP